MCLQHIKNPCDPGMRHNNNDGVTIASSLWLIFILMIYSALLQLSRFLLLPDRWAFSSAIADNSPTLPSLPSCLLSSLRFLLPSRLSSISLHTLSVPPSQWLCGFLHLCYIMALRGTRALQSILQTALPRRTRCKCHVTTWETDICGRRGETTPPRDTYCYQPCSDLRIWLGGRRSGGNTDERD